MSLPAVGGPVVNYLLPKFTKLSKKKKPQFPKAFSGLGIGKIVSPTLSQTHR